MLSARVPTEMEGTAYIPREKQSKTNQSQTNKINSNGEKGGKASSVFKKTRACHGPTLVGRPGVGLGRAGP